MTQPADARRPFGRLLTAMVTPLRADGSVDLPGAARLATYLVDEQGNDGLVINGTTGESPTTTDAEKESLVRAVVEAVGDRAHVVAGVGTNDTRHTVELARSAEKAGAAGLLVVTPYYNRPPQAGLLEHFRTVADATGLRILVYDIPHRTGLAIETATMLRLAEHERIVGVKDAKGSFVDSSQVLRRTDLAYYSGDDANTLPLLSIGGVGLVGTSTHLTGVGAKQLIEAYDRGDMAGALALHRRLLPAFTGIFRTQGTILVKAALNLLDLPGGPVRPPLINASPAEVDQLRADCAEAGVDLPERAAS
jgi:4-hydroxy-tetrahydrodipicolinate synthase